MHAVLYVCPHIACRKVEIAADAGAYPALLKGEPAAAAEALRQNLPDAVFRRRLMPPDHTGKEEFRTEEVPNEIYRDYDEACRLLPVSPSASATFARRCVQGMIRARFKIKPGKLQNEIAALASMSVSQEILEALCTVRKLGKFKAMPEDDVRIIADILPEDAQRIIEIIELLLRDWFVAPSEHDRRLFDLRAASDRKCCPKKRASGR